MNDRTIRATIEGGADSIRDVAAQCGAGTDCGACRRTIGEMVRESRQEESAFAAARLRIRARHASQRAHPPQPVTS